ncbi:type I polyketide synthase, partial [Myxococcota bacterium]|nr:type I polyketide synthase [Myxococcota bacterium]
MAGINKAIEAAVAALGPEQKAALVRALQGPAEPIAVVGVGCRMPGGGDGPARFWELLERGVDAVREIPRDRLDVDALYDPDPSRPGKIATRWAALLDDVRGFDESFFRISPREASSMDPQQRLVLEVAWEALEDAGVAGPSLAGSRTGVFVGVSAVEYSLLGWSLDTIDAYASSGVSKSIVANRISYQLDLRGPSVALDTACSSSLVSVHLAVRALRNGECDQAIASGVNLLLAPQNFVSFTKWGMMASDGRCKTFDHRADGFVRGEGCGAIVLKRLSDAIAAGDPIRAVIRGSAVNQDGKSAGLTAPNLDAQIDCIRRAHADANVRAEQLSFIEAHGTGTALGDPIEVEALAEVFAGSKLRCALGSVKTNLGHLEGAAGIAGIIKVILALEHGAIPPNLHFTKPNPAVKLEGTPFFVPTSLERWSPPGKRIAGVSSFGFGGTNAHVVLEEAPARAAIVERSEPRALLLSAHSDAALRAMAAQHVEHLEREAPRFASVCHTSALRRAHHAHRLAVIATSAAEARERLQGLVEHGRAPKAAGPRVAKKRAPKLAFVFSGQGSVWLGMAKKLAASEPVFTAALREHDAVIVRRTGTSIADLVERGDPSLQKTELGQQAIVAVQAALVKWLASVGVVPSAVVGHSVGELGAALAAGILTADDAVRIIHERAQLMKAHEGHGRMVEVTAPIAEVERAIAGTSLAIAVVNDRRGVIVAGPTQELEPLVAAQQARGVTCRWLDVATPFHGLAIRRHRAELEARVAAVRPSAAKVPFYSTVTGGKLDGERLGAAHWGANLAEPVRFADAIDAMARDGFEVFVELGPSSVLARSIEWNLGDAERSGAAIAVLARGQDDVESSRLALARLWIEGVAIDWKKTFPEGALPHVPPPIYPWQRSAFWGELRGARPPVGAGVAASAG